MRRQVTIECSRCHKIMKESLDVLETSEPVCAKCKKGLKEVIEPVQNKASDLFAE